jgi:predicted CoA-binding protein
MLAALAEALARLAERWAGFDPPDGLGLAELEVNPVVMADDGRLVALDGLARLHRPEPLPPPRPVAELKRLLTPQSAVVVGASAEGLNPGRIILRNLVEGGGVPRERIWAIHPKAVEIEGCRAFPSLAELPEPADLAIVSVAADRGADQVVQEIVEKRRARTVTLIAGGFGETEGGRAAEGRIRAALAASHRSADGGVLLNGGNCLGIISAPGRYNTFFIPPHKLPVREGPGRGLASVSQSGAYLVSQISNLDRVVQPRYAISFGNQMDVTVSDYLATSRATGRVFALYLEGFQRGDGERFLEAVRRITASGRAVLFYKAGRTREGSAAAASHTASAVGDYEVCEELARAAGAVVASSLDQFEDDVTTFTLLDGRSAAGRRVAVLSNGGFEATAAADTLHGMELADLAAATRERLAALLPPGIVDVHNPVDATPVTPTEKYVAIARRSRGPGGAGAGGGRCAGHALLRLAAAGRGPPRGRGGGEGPGHAAGRVLPLDEQAGRLLRRLGRPLRPARGRDAPGGPADVPARGPGHAGAGPLHRHQPVAVIPRDSDGTGPEGSAGVRILRAPTGPVALR